MVAFSKSSSGFSGRSGPPAGARQAVSAARICCCSRYWHRLILRYFSNLLTSSVSKARRSD
jgi:hypothetical protein